MAFSHQELDSTDIRALDALSCEFSFLKYEGTGFLEP